MPKSPVVIVGSPRSGTSALAKALMIVDYRGYNEADQLLSQDTLERIEQHFTENEARFARSYFGPDVLFHPSELAAVAPAHPKAEPRLSEVMEVVGGLLVRFDERPVGLEKAWGNSHLAGPQLKAKAIHDGRH